ncbi:hypothetical protein [Pedobacter aquatilis]|uniref:hypothetical protein n=1 Tax=Pedobacter aquatilis TaxID=351343 RepID=UPI00292FD74E|nr:hypothetical protein [Pedobacter aquatilis]
MVWKKKKNEPREIVQTTDQIILELLPPEIKDLLKNTHYRFEIEELILLTQFAQIITEIILKEDL